MTAKPFEILMAEDNPADVRLAQTAFQRSQCGSVLHVVKDGVDRYFKVSSDTELFRLKTVTLPTP